MTEDRYNTPGKKDDHDKVRTDLVPARALSDMIDSACIEDRSPRDKAFAAVLRFNAGGRPEELLEALAHLMIPTQSEEANAFYISFYDLARVMTYGAKKYGDHNWTKGIKFSRLIAAALRHLSSLAEFDPETDEPHVAHACACLCMLYEEVTSFRAAELDDRNKNLTKGTQA